MLYFFVISNWTTSSISCIPSNTTYFESYLFKLPSSEFKNSIYKTVLEILQYRSQLNIKILKKKKLIIKVRIYKI